MDRRLMNTTFLQEQVKALHALHRSPPEDYGELVSNLNKECGIYCDCIPSYKISTEGPNKDGERKMKKEVFNVEKLEHELLAQYQHFLQLLKRLSHKQHPEQQALGARLCARLLPCAHEFNLNKELIELTVNFANTKATRVAQPCLTALQEYLDGQMVSEGTQLVVLSVLKIVRQQHHALNPKILTLLLAVRIAMIDVHRKDITEEKAKNKRMKKEDRELARQMMKAQGRRDRAELAARQTRILQHIFIIYLRVLQSARFVTNVSHQTRIVAPCLEGLAKFAPLVNLELYDLLIRALKDLLEDDATSVGTKLHALVAVACLAKKDGGYGKSASKDEKAKDKHSKATNQVYAENDWKADLGLFHEILFKCLPGALSPPAVRGINSSLRGKEEQDNDSNNKDNEETQSTASASTIGSITSEAFSIAESMAQHQLSGSEVSGMREWTLRVNVAIRALDLLVLSQRNIPPVRIRAILRRLIGCSMWTPPHIQCTLLSFVHRLLNTYPQHRGILIGGEDNYMSSRGTAAAGGTASLLWDSNATIESVGSDDYQSWELSFVQRSYHPIVRELGQSMRQHYAKVGKKIAGSGPPPVSRQLDSLNPYSILETYDPSMGELRPPPPTLDQHFHKKGMKVNRQENKEHSAGNVDEAPAFLAHGRHGTGSSTTAAIPSGAGPHHFNAVGDDLSETSTETDKTSDEQDDDEPAQAQSTAAAGKRHHSAMGVGSKHATIHAAAARPTKQRRK